MVTNTPFGVRENPTLHEIYRGTISAHHAKAGYDYPTIRLPLEFTGLIGLSTRVYQTIHEGALAFLVVVSSSHKSEESAKESENVATSSKPSPLHGEGRAFESPRNHRFFFQSDAKMKAEVHEDWDEKLCNFGVAETDESLARNMTDR